MQLTIDANSCFVTTTDGYILIIAQVRFLLKIRFIVILYLATDATTRKGASLKRD